VDERVPQVTHPRGRDRQRPAPAASISRPQTQIELVLPGRQPLPCRGLQQLDPNRRG
jgi:hypothetical protein